MLSEVYWSLAGWGTLPSVTAGEGERREAQVVLVGVGTGTDVGRKKFSGCTSCDPRTECEANIHNSAMPLEVSHVCNASG